jgi:hypothetical protein
MMVFLNLGFFQNFEVGEDLEGVTHKVYFDIQINGSPAGLKFPPFFLFYLRV